MSYNKAPPHDSGLMVPRVPHKPDHGVQVVYQRLVPPEDLGPGAPVVGEPVPKVGHQGRQPTGVEHRLKGPAGNEDGHSRPPLTSPGRDHGQGGEGGGRARTLTPTTTTVGIAIIMSFVCAVGWLGGVAKLGLWGPRSTGSNPDFTVGHLWNLGRVRYFLKASVSSSVKWE